MEALLLKLCVTHCEHFIDDEYLWLQMYGNCKRQTHIHAAGVTFDGRINELIYFVEGDYLIEFSLDLHFLHAENRAVEVDVFASGQFRMEAGTDFEERANAAAYFNFAFSRGGDARKDFQQR